MQLSTANGNTPVTFDDSLVTCISALDAEAQSLTFRRDNHPPRTYSFDGIFGPDSAQDDVFGQIAAPVVDDVLTGFNATVLAYGQTGTGKTFTMAGPQLAGLLDGLAASPPSPSGSEAGTASAASAAASSAGILPRSIMRVFQRTASDSGHAYSISVAYVQVYCEQVHDLLAPGLDATSSNGGAAGAWAGSGLAIREDPEAGVYVEGCTWVPVSEAEQCLRVVAVGSRNRAVAATLMNAHSSRSHAVFMLRVERKTKAKAEAASSQQAQVTRVQRGTLFLVDLAGSERVSKSGVTGLHLDEMRAINLSLSALGNCISALAARSQRAVSAGKGPSAKIEAMKQVHIPYRDSKLTRLLQDSLGGNARTSLIITISAAASSVAETQSTLEFGCRAAQVRVHAVRNEVVDYRSLYLSLRNQMEGRATPSNLLPALSSSGASVEANEDLLLEVSRLRSTIATLTDENRALRSAALNASRPAASSQPAVAASDGVEKAAAQLRTAMSTSAESAPALSDLLAAFDNERAATRAQHTAALAAANERHAMELARVKGAFALLQTDHERSQDDLLVALTEQRKLRDKLRDTERSLNSRVGALLEELSEARNNEDETTRRCEAAEADAELLRQQLRQVMVAVQLAGPGGGSGVGGANFDALAEITRLYEQSISNLHSRVESLEARSQQQTLIVQELAYRLRVKSQADQALAEVEAERGHDSEASSAVDAYTGTVDDVSRRRDAAIAAALTARGPVSLAATGGSAAVLQQQQSQHRRPASEGSLGFKVDSLLPQPPRQVVSDYAQQFAHQSGIGAGSGGIRNRPSTSSASSSSVYQSYNKQADPNGQQQQQQQARAFEFATAVAKSNPGAIVTAGQPLKRGAGPSITAVAPSQASLTLVPRSQLRPGTADTPPSSLHASIDSISSKGGDQHPSLSRLGPTSASQPSAAVSSAFLATANAAALGLGGGGAGPRFSVTGLRKG